MFVTKDTDGDLWFSIKSVPLDDLGEPEEDRDDAEMIGKQSAAYLQLDTAILTKGQWLEIEPLALKVIPLPDVIYHQGEKYFRRASGSVAQMLQEGV